MVTYNGGVPMSVATTLIKYWGVVSWSNNEEFFTTISKLFVISKTSSWLVMPTSTTPPGPISRSVTLSCDYNKALITL